MAAPAADYEPLYLAGTQFFNAGDYFEAHEVWEDLWNECGDADRRFYQALIQAAVALYHFEGGNLRGAKKLYASAHRYMSAYPSPHRGLDHAAFWGRMAACFAEVLADGQDLLRRDLRPDPAAVPRIELDPPPADWPDPRQFLDEDE